MRLLGPGPRQVDPTVPATLDRIVRKCLRKDPSERYETAVQLAAELERFQRKEELVHTPVDTVVQYLLLWVRQHRELTSRLTALGSILALTQFNYFVILRKEPRDLKLHMIVTSVELLWIFFSIVFDPRGDQVSRGSPALAAECWPRIALAAGVALLRPFSVS